MYCYLLKIFCCIYCLSPRRVCQIFSKDLNFFEQRSFSTVGVQQRLDCIILIGIVMVLSELVMSIPCSCTVSLSQSQSQASFTQYPSRSFEPLVHSSHLYVLPLTLATGCWHLLLVQYLSHSLHAHVPHWVNTVE